MNERSTLELEEEMARLRDQLKLVGEQGRATRELHTRELTPETKVAHEGRLEEMNHLLEAYHRIAQELSQRTGAYSSGPLSCRQGRCTALSRGFRPVGGEPAGTTECRSPDWDPGPLSNGAKPYPVGRSTTPRNSAPSGKEPVPDNVTALRLEEFRNRM